VDKIDHHSFVLRVYSTDMETAKTCLNSWHRAHGGKMVDFAGWDMPVNYQSGAKQEHLMVRRSCGLFDISHMGRFLISCPDESALADYERIISSPVGALKPGTGSYGLICREDGGILDDIFNFRLDESTFLLVVNAANRKKDFDWIAGHGSAFRLENISDDVGMIALQGPKAMELLQLCGFGDKVSDIGERNSISRGNLLDDGIFTRTGYTGEDGVEIYAPNAAILSLWNLLLEQAEARGVECGPVGLAARDSLRFEPGYALYGHELTEDITPREALLKWACKLAAGDPDFIGKVAIQARYAQEDDFHKLRTVKLSDQGMPRQDMKIFDGNGDEIGWVCSGMASPTLEAFYANCYIRQGSSQIGNQVYIDIRGRRKAAEVVKRPIYRVL
jgi:glycine cleavage system T protein